MKQEDGSVKPEAGRQNSEDVSEKLQDLEKMTTEVQITQINPRRISWNLEPKLPAGRDYQTLIL